MALFGYTCITCAVAFANTETQRAHYKTDWHHYNLKRKVAELPPVNADDFKQRVLAIRAEDAQAKEHHSHYCRLCKKTFASDKSYDSHLRSRKHREKGGKLSKEEKDEAVGTEDASDDERVRENMKNLDISSGESKKFVHSEKGNNTSHPKGLSNGDQATRSQEAQAVEEDEFSDEGTEQLDIDECLFCPLVSESMEANLRHMSSVHGFFIPDLDYLVDLKGLMEYLCYRVSEEKNCLYCKTARVFHSVEAIQHHMVDKAHCKLFFEGDAALEYAEFFDYTKSYQQFEKGGREESADDLPKPDNSLTVNDDLELVLPSGSKACHRSMKQYYKQRLPTLEHRRSTMVTRLMAQYRSIGWKGGYEGELERKRVQDEAWRRKMQQKRDMKLSIRANKLQHHFRPQVVF